MRGHQVHVGQEAYTVDETCEAGRFGRTTFYAQLKKGRLRARKLGSKTLVLRADLLDFLKSLPDATE
jgi:excisionase family DNA binding protein